MANLELMKFSYLLGQFKAKLDAWEMLNKINQSMSVNAGAIWCKNCQQWYQEHEVSWSGEPYRAECVKGHVISEGDMESKVEEIDEARETGN